MKVAVYGASGHTGRFVIAELLRRGHAAIAIGRDPVALAASVPRDAAAVETRAAALDSAASLDRALRGAAAVINCAGPFLDTARPVIEAALRNRIHYIDVTAEQASATATLDGCDRPARERGICIVPAAGFYGGLGDVLATAAMGDWTSADSVDLAIALDSWHPTRGTRTTGERNTAPRLVFAQGTLRPIEPAEAAPRAFAPPFGEQSMVEVPLTEAILLARHLRVRDIRNFINAAPLRDLENAATPPPIATDERGRSDQQFLFEVDVRRGDDVRGIGVRGRDIYAATAPIVVEAVEQMFAPRGAAIGALTLAQLVDAPSFLNALVRDGHLAMVE